MKAWTKTIHRLGACTEAIRDLQKWDDIETWWQDCERGDWMLWLLGKLSGEPGSDKRRKLVLTACECARLALPNIKTGEDRPLKAIEIAEAWARGEGGVSLDDVRKAAYAAYAAAYAAAAAAAADAARFNTLKKCADIVRKHYPEAPNV